ncbi:MAG: hypothetical protein NTW73_00290 [Candidatus Parcubacteria bacterium]|nr:hypothetical protein [Candidatus Parcubacteria bacterium]
MHTEDDIIKNLQHCPHFNSCSQNLCLLDLELHLRSGKKQDRCRWMKEPKRVKIAGREFISGGAIMPDVPLNFVPQDNLQALNEASQKRYWEIKNL